MSRRSIRDMDRRALAVPLLVAAVTLVRLPAAPAAPSAAPSSGPVATNDATYTAFGRVFPDPHAYGPLPVAPPGFSPWAKGNAVGAAKTFVSYDEAISGLTYLEQRYPDFVELYKLDEDFKDVLDLEEGDGLSAGLPDATLARTKTPLYLVRVTDERVPETAKKYFAVSMSIHGIERAGLEGGIRAIEDLATWGAESPDQPIMETVEDSLPAGEVLKRSSVFFLLANPDGWRRGDLSTGGPFFSRYNGNGVDLNRDWPAEGYTYRPYTPWSEPETRSFGKVLKSIRAKWDGGLDLHGQMNASAFSFTLLRSSQRPFDENQRMLQYVKGAWVDAEQRLSWSQLIKPNDAPADDARMYGVQWGTTWDTIGYTNTGSISNWMDSELGLGADAVSNEMSLSHLTNCGTGNCFIPEIEQLHIDGNKSLIYGLVNYTLLPEDTTFSFEGRATWLDHGRRLRHAGAPIVTPPPTELPPDVPFTMQHQGETSTFEFDVPKPVGGVTATVTYTNAGGVGTGDQMALYLDRHAPDDPKAETDPDGWETVQSDNPGGGYVGSGSQVDVVSPVPGKYRVRVTGAVPGQVNGVVSFSQERAWEDPGQLPYDASNVDFFPELARHVPSPDKLVRMPVAGLLNGSAPLPATDTLVAVDQVFSAAATPAQRTALGKRLTEFVKGGGNLVLTDDSLRALEWMGLVPPESVRESEVYAGFVQFQKFTEGETVLTYDDPLAEGVAQPGAAEGTDHRHQITDPGPIGYAILTPEGGDAQVQPQWGIAQDAFEAAGGRIAGMVFDDVTLGEIEVGKGRVRVLGSLVPFPSNEYDIPHGVADYAITYAGYEITRNLLSHRNPSLGPVVGRPPVAPPAPPAPPRPTEPGPLPSTGWEPPLLLPLAALLGAYGLLRRRRA